jgi:hypothetical protein
MTNQSAVTIIDQAPVPAKRRGAVTPMVLLQTAIERGASVEELGQLMALQERMLAIDAKRAYTEAKAAFMAEAPRLKKNKHVKFPTRTGPDTEYEHITLDHAVDTLAPILSKHGITHGWKTEQKDGLIKVTCILTHVMGHEEHVSLEAGAETSGTKNAIQSIGSTVSYLERYTFLAITGQAAKGMDNDGAGSGQVDYITEKQAMDLETSCEAVGGDKVKFLRQFAADSFAKIPAPQFAAAVSLLEKKKATQK